jgi:hypothetical protein
MFILATTTVSTWGKFDIDYMIFQKLLIFFFINIYFSRKTKESDGMSRNISLFCQNGILKINKLIMWKNMCQSGQGIITWYLDARVMNTGIT